MYKGLTIFFVIVDLFKINKQIQKLGTNISKSTLKAQPGLTVLGYSTNVISTDVFPKSFLIPSTGLTMIVSNVKRMIRSRDLIKPCLI